MENIELMKKEFLDGISTKDLSKKYNVDLMKLRKTLKNSLGDVYKKQIRKIAGIYGSNSLIKKLNKDIVFRDEYSKKMSNSVSSSIKTKMLNKKYKKLWREKAKKASMLGHEKVRLLLEENPDFRRVWIKNCVKGGKKTYKTKKGAYDPKNKIKRMLGSIKGLKKTTRKILGPKGEFMYNLHESKVANILLKNNYDYIYEKRYRAKNQNGYFSCDFVIPTKIPKIIEATYWDDVPEKCKRFNIKYKFLKNVYEKFDFWVVVTNTLLKDKYSKNLRKNIVVMTPKDFDENLKNNSGRRI